MQRIIAQFHWQQACLRRRFSLVCSFLLHDTTVARRNAHALDIPILSSPTRPLTCAYRRLHHTMRSGLLRIPLALSVVRSFPVLVRSRPVSTEAAAENSTASKPVRMVVVRGDRLVEEMTPIATFLGVVASIGAVGAYYSSRLAALEERMAGVMKEVDAKVSGMKETIEKEVNAKVSGTKETIEKEVNAKMAGTKETIDAKIAGFEKAVDIKVSFLYLALAPSSPSSPFSPTFPTPLHLRSTRQSDSLSHGMYVSKFAGLLTSRTTTGVHYLMIYIINKPTSVPTIAVSCTFCCCYKRKWELAQCRACPLNFEAII